MTHKRQFSGVTKPRTFYDRKVGHYGQSRTLSLTKIIPKDWQYVRITPLKADETTFVIEVKKLLGANNNGKKTDNSEPRHS